MLIIAKSNALTELGEAAARKRPAKRAFVAIALLAMAGCGGGGDGDSDGDAGTPPAPSGSTTDWQTFQGNAGHTGYVNESYVASSFQLAWTWPMPVGTRNWMNMVAAGAGRIYVTEDAQQSHLYALDESTGVLQWSTQFVDSIETGAPAFANGNVYVTTQTAAQLGDSWKADIKVIDATNGALKFTQAVHSQMGAFFPVTPYQNAIYSSNDNFFVVNGIQYYGTELTSFASASSHRNWLTYDTKSFSYSSQSVAADTQYVYFYRSFSQSGLSNALVVLDRATGASVREIADGRNKYPNYAYYGAPMISSPGHVVCFSDGQFLASVALEENFAPRALIRYDISNGAISWTSSDEYLTSPAVTQGQVIAASNATGRLDALDEQTGVVLWSWSAPSGEAFIRNIVAANNVVFVSTDQAVYAIDISTHQQVWRYASPGGLAIANHQYLLIASPARRDNAQATLTAIRLK